MLTKTEFANICQCLLSNEDISNYEANLIYSAVYDREFPYKDDLVAIASKFRNIGSIEAGRAADAAYTLLRAYIHNTFTPSQFEILGNTCSLPVAYALIQNKALPLEFFYSFKRFERLDVDAFVYNKDFIAKAFKENFYYFRRQKSMSIISSIRNKLSQEGTNADALTDQIILKVYGVEGFIL